jgi:hypothetical protein
VPLSLFLFLLLILILIHLILTRSWVIPSKLASAAFRTALYYLLSAPILGTPFLNPAKMAVGLRKKVVVVGLGMVGISFMYVGL